jgi:hypothetical protein
MHTHLNDVRGVQKVSSLTKLPCRRLSAFYSPRVHHFLVVPPDGSQQPTTDQQTADPRKVKPS